MPVDMDDRLMWRERFDPIEAARSPCPILANPIERILRIGALAPMPSFVIPEFLVLIAAVIDECRELGIGDGGTRHAERPNIDGMRPFLIVECKRRGRE